jgi:hypothetical protein
MIKRKLPSLLVDASTNSKKGWKAFMRYRFENFKKRNLEKFNSLMNKTIACSHCYTEDRKEFTLCGLLSLLPFCLPSAKRTEFGVCWNLPSALWTESFWNALNLWTWHRSCTIAYLSRFRLFSSILNEAYHKQK